MDAPSPERVRKHNRAIAMVKLIQLGCAVLIVVVIIKLMGVM